MGIAIIAVFLHHLCLRIDLAWHMDPFPFSFFANGNVGVDLFFFASAFGCCASLDHNPYGHYLLKRACRIYPQYIIFLTIVFIWFFPQQSILHKLKVSILSLSGLAPFNCFHTKLEWFIPSLLLIYVTLPFLKQIMNASKRVQSLMMISALFSSWGLLKLEWVYWAFQCRIPVIMCGIFAYLNRNNLSYCIKLFAVMLCLSLCTKEDMLIHSMIIPLLMTSLSLVNLKSLPLYKLFSWFGRHSFEFFLAQTITTQFVMYSYFWQTKWLSIVVIIGETALFGFLFGIWQIMFDWAKTKLLARMI